MPTVKTNFFEDGDTPTAAELNSPYDDVATASAAIDGDNISDNSITRAHLAATSPCNEFFSYVEETTSFFTTSSTSYVTIDSTGVNPSEVTLNYQPDPWELTRFEISGLVTSNEVNSTFDNALAAADMGKPNYYAFQLLLTYNDGGASSTVTLGEWGYSFSTATSGRYYTAANGVATNTGSPLSYQTFQFSTTYQYTGGAGVRTWEKVELQCKVYSASNVLKISRNNIIAIRAKH